MCRSAKRLWTKILYCCIREMEESHVAPSFDLFRCEDGKIVGGRSRMVPVICQVARKSTVRRRCLIVNTMPSTPRKSAMRAAGKKIRPPSPAAEVELRAFRIW